MAFTKQSANDTMYRIREAITLIALEEGMTSRVTGSYDETTLKLTVKIETVGLSGDSKEEADFKRYAKSFGLDPSWLGRSFNHAGAQYTITGLAPNRTKYPVSAMKGGRSMKLTADKVKHCMAA